MFNHQDVTFESLTRETIDGVRYYKVPGTDKLVKLPSITSVISYKNRQVQGVGREGWSRRSQSYSS